jgi:NADH-quinone oxidoreductase subunit G
MLEQPRKAYLLWNLEPEYDTADPALALSALGAADTVIAFSCFRNGALEYADVILPIAPTFETSGSFVSCEGRLQQFNGAVRPFAEARPGWKVLRVLGTQLGLAGFEFDTPEAVRAALPAVTPERLDGRIDVAPALPAAASGLERVADVPVYWTDPLVRRAESLQLTADARPPKLSANSRVLSQAGLKPGDKARVRQGEAAALLEVARDDRLPDGVLRVPAGHAATSTLGAMFGAISVERA